MLYLLALLTLSMNIGLGSRWTACVSTGLLCAIILLILDGPARRFGFVDQPCGRKAHAVPTPLTGGLAIALAYVAMSCLGHASETHAPLLAGIVTVGLLDDLLGLTPRLRLFLEATAGLILIYFAGTGVQSLGNLLGYGSIDLGVLAVPFTVLVLVGLINAINMSDGLDGLAAGLSITSLGWMLTAVILAGADAPSGLPIFIAAIGGFMALNSRHPFNPRAVAFLGDSGSMLLGLCLGWYAIHLSQGASHVLSPASVLWILGLPVVDTLRVMFTRPLKRKLSPFSAGRDHLHHVLQGLGFSPGATAWLIIAINGGLGAVGVFGPRLGLSEPVLTYTFIGLASVFWLAVPTSRFIGECGRDVSNCQPNLSEGCTPDLRCWPKRRAPVLQSVSNGTFRHSYQLRAIEPEDAVVDLSPQTSAAPLIERDTTDSVRTRASRQ